MPILTWPIGFLEDAWSRQGGKKIHWGTFSKCACLPPFSWDLAESLKKLDKNIKACLDIQVNLSLSPQNLSEFHLTPEDRSMQTFLLKHIKEKANVCRLPASKLLSWESMQLCSSVSKIFDYCLLSFKAVSKAIWHALQYWLQCYNFEQIICKRSSYRFEKRQEKDELIGKDKLHYLRKCNRSFSQL